MSMFREVVLPAALFTTITLGLIIGVAMGVSEFEGRRTCRNYGAMTGYEVKWLTLDACYVKRDGRWYRNGVNVIEIAEDRSRDK